MGAGSVELRKPGGIESIGDDPARPLFVQEGTGASNPAKAEDSAHSSGDKGMFVLAVRQDTPGSSVSTDGDYAALQVDDVGNLRVRSLIRGTFTDKSGTITSGATQQTLAAANSSRKYLFIQNQSSTDDLWINFGTNAVQDQPSIRIPPRSYFEMTGLVDTQIVSIIGPTTGQKFTAKEM